MMCRLEQEPLMGIETAKKPNRWLGVGLRVLAVLVGLLVAATVVWDIFWPIQGGGTPLAQQGVKAGAWVGLAIRTTILGGLALFLWSKARSVLDPAHYGREAVTRRRFADAVDSERGLVIKEPTSISGFYSKNTDEELLGIYRSIDPGAAGERFNELVLEIRRRTETFFLENQGG